MFYIYIKMLMYMWIKVKIYYHFMNISKFQFLKDYILYFFLKSCLLSKLSLVFLYYGSVTLYLVFLWAHPYLLECLRKSYHSCNLVSLAHLYKLPMTMSSVLFTAWYKTASNNVCGINHFIYMIYIYKSNGSSELYLQICACTHI